MKNWGVKFDFINPGTRLHPREVLCLRQIYLVVR